MFNWFKKKYKNEELLEESLQLKSKIFTFGREHEIKHAIYSLGSAEKAILLTDVIHSVHDFLENKVLEEEVKEKLYIAFSEGKSGVWGYTESWIRKLGIEYSSFLQLWDILSQNKSYIVRFRVACVLNNMPKEIAKEIGQKLIHDKSKKVKSMAEVRLKEMKIK